MDRRKFLKGTGALASAGILAGLYSWQIEPYWLEYVYRKMPIKKLTRPPNWKNTDANK